MNRKLIGSAAKYIVSAVVSVLIILYIVYHLLNSFGTPVETSPAQLVTVNETITVEAYVLRDEKVLVSAQTGGVNCLYQDGTMVRRNSAVADVYSGNETAAVKERIAEIDDKIKILEDSGMAESAALNDSASISGSLDSLYYTVLEKINQQNIDYAFRRKNEMLTLMNKRQIAQRFVYDFSTQIAELKKQRAQLTASLTDISETVYAPESGYFYSEVDGYEETFTGGLCDSLTVADFKKLTETEPADHGSNVVGKIAVDYKWYIVCLMETGQAKSFIEKNKYTAIFPYNADAEIPMTLYRSVQDDSGEQTMLIFSTGNVDGNFSFLRRQTVDLVQNTYTGYRVPVSAVRIVDGKEGVYILNGNLVSFREITPIAEIDGNLIVEERDPADPDHASKLGFYDQIITKGKNIYENKIVG